MSIRKGNNDKYTVDVYIKDNGKRKRIRKEFLTRAEAKDFEAEARKSKNIVSGRNSLGNSTRTIREMADYYFSLARYLILKPRSKIRNKQLIGHLISWCEINNIKYIHDFTGETAQKYIAHISGEYQGKGKHHNFIAAKMIFAEELRRDNPCISKNPFNQSSPFKRTKSKPLSMSEDLIKILRDNMSEFEKNIYDIMYYTGCRNGELLFLTWNEVEKDKVNFCTHQIYDKKLGKWVEWTTKTSNDRTVPLNEAAQKCFAKLKNNNIQYNYVLPDECRDNAHWLTRTFEEIKRRVVELNPRMESILFPLDKNKNITPKRFRSTFITHIIRHTGNMKIAAILAGHSDIQTTNNHYTDADALDICGAVGGLKLK